jgi:hypothetical protein
MPTGGAFEENFRMSVNPAIASADLSSHRILVGPNEIAGVSSRIAKALARAGADVLFFNGHDHPFDPHLEESKNLRRLYKPAVARASRWLSKGGPVALLGLALSGAVKAAAFIKACVWAQTLVMIGGKGFFGGGLEYAFFRLLGKRVVHVFVGTASRPRYLSGYAKGVVKDGVVNQRELKRLAQRTKRQARRIRGISRHASMVVENPLCGHFQERPFVNWFKLGVPLDIAALEKKPRVTDATPPRVAGKVRVLHSPSRPEIKGSARIQAVMEKLVREGLPLEFRQVTGVPHGQVLHEITQADFVVDQLYSDSPLAGFAAEASAFGKAAVVGGYGWHLFPAFLKPQEMPPTAYCHPDDLENCIRSLTLDPARRETVGRQSRAFLEAQWSEAAFAARFAQIVAGKVPEDWWVAPTDVRYTLGLGLEAAEAQCLIRALLEHYGPEILQLDHLPQLREAFVKFGQTARA